VALIEPPALVAYLSFTFLLAITPGASTAVVVRNTLAHGRTAGWSTAAGAALGNVSHATAAGFGLALLFARWPPALLALRSAGAAYLAWLGATSTYRALRHHDGGIQMMSAAPAERVSRRGSFTQGLFVTLLNPATITFYLVVVPSFAPPSGRPTAFAVLAAIYVAMALCCHLLWATAMETLRRFFRRPVARRAFEAATGLALLTLAARIIVSR
jgi:threonine/homoserine/homoserine lactone efflux protein